MNTYDLFPGYKTISLFLFGLFCSLNLLSNEYKVIENQRKLILSKSSIAPSQPTASYSCQVTSSKSVILNPKKVDSKVCPDVRAINSAIHLQWAEKGMLFSRNNILYKLKCHAKLDISLGNVNSYTLLNDIVQLLKYSYPFLLFTNTNNYLKTVLLYITSLFSFITFTLLLFAWYNFNQSKKSLAVLKEINNEMEIKNADLHKSLISLEQSHKDNTRIMQVVAHDLRSPLGAINSITTMLMEEDGFSDDHKKVLGLIRSTTASSLNLIGDLLHVNTVDDGLKKEPVFLDSLLGHCIELLKFQAQEKQQTIVLDAEKIQVNLNSEKIWRVISNLVSNAIKFSHKESTIQVSLKQKFNVVEIAIKDNGIGIPDKLKDKIFEISGKAKRNGTAGEHSFGLGLVISKQIVQAHRGRLWFESEDKRGTTFFVELPL